MLFIVVVIIIIICIYKYCMFLVSSVNSQKMSICIHLVCKWWSRKDNIDQLGKIVSVLGTRDLIAYIMKCRVDTSPDVRNILLKYSSRTTNNRGESRDYTRRVPWLSFWTVGCPMPSDDALDLLDKLLVYDQDMRLTAQEAMSHPFFDAVRDRVLVEVQHQVQQQR